MIKIYENRAIVNKEAGRQMIYFCLSSSSLSALPIKYFLNYSGRIREDCFSKRAALSVHPPTSSVSAKSGCIRLIHPQQNNTDDPKWNNDYNSAKYMNSCRPPKMPTTEDLERAERLHEVIEALCEVNRSIPVVVEGKKDLQALRRLGLSGDIIPLHGGKGLYEFSEELAEKFPKVILLPDWDTKGEALFTSLKENLHGHWEEYSAFRDLLRMICQKEIKDIEGIPKLLLRLEGSD